jgi:hypothetical protein
LLRQQPCLPGRQRMPLAVLQKLPPPNSRVRRLIPVNIRNNNRCAATPRALTRDCDHYFAASALPAAAAESDCDFLALSAAKNLSSRYGFFCACKVPRQNCVCCWNYVSAEKNSLGERGWQPARSRWRRGRPAASSSSVAPSKRSA